MAKLTPEQVASLALSAGLSPDKAIIATAIAKGESQYVSDAVGDVALQDERWGPSIGLWQIRSIKSEEGTGSARDASRLRDPAFNARSMATISRSGSYWQPWSVYTSGAYRAHLREASLAVQKATTGPVPAVPGSEPDPALREAPGGGISALLDPRTWRRLLWTVGGAILILIGLILIGREMLDIDTGRIGELLGSLR